MIEIFALVYLSKKIGLIAVQKGQKPGTWKVYTVLAWFGMEVLGGIIASLFFGAENIIPLMLVAIPFAIGGYHIVKTILEKMPDANNDINQIGEHLEY